MCNKMGFTDRHSAKEYVRQAYKSIRSRTKQSKKFKQLKKLLAYECPRCGLFHLTSMSKKSRRDFVKKIKRKRSVESLEV